jgi:hypothetical protein
MVSVEGMETDSIAKRNASQNARKFKNDSI